MRSSLLTAAIHATCLLSLVLVVRFAAAAEPDPKALKTAEALIYEVFKDEYGLAKSPADQVALAKFLLEKSAENKSNLGAYYVMLRDAADYAAKGGDPQTGLAAVDVLASQFELPAGELRIAFLEKATATNDQPGVQHKIATTALATLQQALDADDLPLARRLQTVAKTSATKAADAGLTQDVADFEQQFEVTEKLTAELRKAQEKLSKNPLDGDAATAVGKDFAFRKGDWEHGLPLLASSNDLNLASQAREDLAQPTEPARQFMVGDGWWDIARKGDLSRTQHVEARAAFWYRQALPGLNGLERARIERRLKDLDAAAARHGRPRRFDPELEAEVRKLLPGLLVTPYARQKSQEGNDGGFVDASALGEPVGARYVIADLAKWKFPEKQNAVAEGYLLIERPGEYAFNSNNFYDRNALWVNTELVCSYRDGEQKVQRITLEKGLIPLKSVGYVNARGSVEVHWQPPGQAEMSAIPAELLFYKSPVVKE